MLQIHLVIKKTLTSLKHRMLKVLLKNQFKKLKNQDTSLQRSCQTRLKMQLKNKKNSCKQEKRLLLNTLKFLKIDLNRMRLHLSSMLLDQVITQSSFKEYLRKVVELSRRLIVMEMSHSLVGKQQMTSMIVFIISNGNQPQVVLSLIL